MLSWARTLARRWCGEHLFSTLFFDGHAKDYTGSSNLAWYFISRDQQTAPAATTRSGPATPARDGGIASPPNLRPHTEAHRVLPSTSAVPEKMRFHSRTNAIGPRVPPAVRCAEGQDVGGRAERWPREAEMTEADQSVRTAHGPAGGRSLVVSWLTLALRNSH